jgi:hypothetical protein
MFRFVARHGLVRLIGGRAVPAMFAWDLLVLANRARRIPVVDRGLRRGAGAARRGVGAVVTSRPTLPIPRRRRVSGNGRPDRDA